MRIVRTIAVAGLVLAPIAAGAQHTKTGAGARVAGIAPPPAPVVLRGSRFERVPVVVSPDGRVFANFGRGFEQIVRACGVSNDFVGGSMQPEGVLQPRVVQPTVEQPGIVVARQPFTPPVPAQQTESQQMLGRQAGVQQQVVAPSRNCWSTDGRGQVFVGWQ